MDKLYIVIPAYNESETIRSVIKDWYRIAERTGSESRLVIIDDGSKDDSLAKCRLWERDERVRIFE